MSQPLFTGVGVALITLFDSDGEVDAKATGEHAARLVDAGVRAVVTAGTTGEAATLSSDERIAVLEAVREAVPDEVPVVAGTGAPSPRQAAALTANACAHGADAVLALSQPGSKHLVDYYTAVADAAGDVPVLGYHFPVASAPGIPLDVLPTLPVQGMKDSSGECERLLGELADFDGWVYVGSTAIVAYASLLGCPGAILQLANAEPELCIAAFGGDAQAQRTLFPHHLDMRRDSPRNLKRMAAGKYGISPVCRV